jgi:bis(5'-nucleosyl)-tetraphosphatase (symmetrical)
MATYAIGDVQGCYDALLTLLDRMHFNEHDDRLWFTGDLVNRGPKSLEVLRFVKNLGDRHVVILGNHDLHLLAVAYTDNVLNASDTLETVLAAPDREELLSWLRWQRFLYEDADLNYVITHAGIYPLWDLASAKMYASEIEHVMTSDMCMEFLPHMYGDQPDIWHDDLQGWDRYRFIVNAFSRMRYCYRTGALNLVQKGKPEDAALELIPWFRVPGRQPIDRCIIFGHWASLEGSIEDPNLFAIDTGYVWGHTLTALRLEDQHYVYTQATENI